MSKELTEQWHEGTLPQGYYYIVVNLEQKHRVIFYLPERNTEDEARLDLKDQFVLEVLAPVPSYDQFAELSKKVKELEERLTDDDKTIERLQEQLKEARHTIYCIANTDGSDCKTILETIIRDANKYLEKRGVK